MIGKVDDNDSKQQPTKWESCKLKSSQLDRQKVRVLTWFSVSFAKNRR